MVKRSDPVSLNSSDGFRKSRTIAVSAIAIILMAFGVNPAAADTSGAWGTYGPYMGISYKNLATMKSAPLGTRLEVRTTSGSAAPANYMQVRGELYKNGGLCLDTGAYNGNPAGSSSWAIQSTGSCGYGNYQSKGSSRSWNYTTWATFYAYPTPTVMTS